MAGKKRPSFLKRQKEQKRMARAAEKHEARRLKKQRRLTEVDEPGGPDPTEIPTEERDQEEVDAPEEAAEVRSDSATE